MGVRRLFSRGGGKTILFWPAKGGKCPLLPSLRTLMIQYDQYFMYLEYDYVVIFF